MNEQPVVTPSDENRPSSLRSADRLTVVCLCAAIGAWELVCVVFAMFQDVGLPPLWLSWFASIIAVASGHAAQHLRRRNRSRLPRRLVAGLVAGWLGVLLTCPVVIFIVVMWVSVNEASAAGR